MIYPRVALLKKDIRQENGRHEAGVCSELHVTTSTFRTSENSLTATVAPEDYANIVSNLQSAVCLNVARRAVCPAHDSKLWKESRQQRPSIWREILKFAKKLLVVLISLFYIAMPPWPTRMFRKAVFCHPRRGAWYYLIAMKGAERKAIFRASEAKEYDKLAICLPKMVTPPLNAIEVFYHLLRCKPFLLPFDGALKLCAMELYCEQSIRFLHRDRNRKKIRSPNLIIFAQPNSSDIGCCLMMDPNFADIADFLQCDLLIFDYPGYGVSDGKTNEKSVYAAIDAIMHYAMEQLGYPSEKIILIGFSLGTAAMVHVAERFKVAALVLIAPFTSLFRIICRSPSIARPWFDMFPSLEKSQKITSPTLICHGERDRLVSHGHGVQLKENIPDCELYLIKHASHQGIFIEREMWDKVEQFLGQRAGITRNWIEHKQCESTMSSII